MSQSSRTLSAIESAMADSTQNFLDQMPVGVIIYALQDGDFVAKACNEAATKIVHQNKKLLIGQKLQELSPGVEDSPLIPGFMKALEENEPFSIERINRNNDQMGNAFSIHAFAIDKTHLASLFFNVEVRTGGSQEEQKLVDKLAELTNTLELSQVGIGQYDWVNLKIHFNEPFAKSLGYELDELPRDLSFWESRFHPEDEKSTLQKKMDHLEGKTPFYEVEHRIKHKDGHWKYFLTRGHVTRRNEQGAPIAGLGIHIDIDETKRANQKLMVSSEMLEAAMQGTNMALWDWDIPKEHIKVNENFYSMLNYSPGEIDPNPAGWEKLIPPEDLKRATKSIQDHFAGKTERHQLEVDGITKEGEKKRILISGKVVERDDDGTPLRAAGVNIDVNQQHLMEQALQEKDALFFSLFDSMEQGITVHDETGRIIQANAAAERFFGYTEYEFAEGDPELHLWKAWHEDGTDLSYEDSPIATVIKTRKNASLTHRLKSPRMPEPRWIRVYAYPIFRDDGSLLKILATYEDLTEIKQEEQTRLEMERKMQQSQRLESLGLMAGGIAHDFNNLLMAIQGNMELVDDSELDKTKRLYIQNALSACEKANDLTNQMLAYAGKSPFRKESFSLPELLKDYSGFLSTVIHKKIRLEINDDGNPNRVHGDRSQIQQIILNFITNSAEAIGDQNGEISVRTSTAFICQEQIDDISKLGIGTSMTGKEADENPPKEGWYTRLSIQDTGCGIDKKLLNKIFEPFYTSKFTGRGLGLSAVLGIVRAHDGILTVESEQGIGSTFHVLLPADQTAEEGTETPLEETPLPTILVVDDEEFVRELAIRFVRKLGYEPVYAINGKNALDVLESNRGKVDAVLMDVGMPEMDGHEALRMIRKEHPEIPVILTSGQPSDVNEEIEKPDGFLQKPYRLDDFREMIDSLGIRIG